MFKEQSWAVKIVSFHEKWRTPYCKWEIQVAERREDDDSFLILSSFAYLGAFHFAPFNGNLGVFFEHHARF